MNSVSEVLLNVACAMAFCLPGAVLRLLHYNYSETGGTILTKIHPATYALFAAVALQIGFRRGVLRELGTPLLKTFGLYFAALVAFEAYVLLVLHLTGSYVIDTWAAPGAALFLLVLASPGQLARTSVVMSVALIVNFALSVYEGLSHHLLIPLYLVDATTGRVLDTSGWSVTRATALLGHPLIGTAVAGTVSAASAAVMAFRRSNTPTLALCVLALIALPFFGGRLGLIVACVSIGMVGLVRLGSLLRGRGVPPLTLAALFSIAALAPLALTALADSGALGELMRRFTDDNGSAGTREVALRLLLNYPLGALVLGDTAHALVSMQREQGTIYGIEISWVAFILMYGAIFLIVLMTAFSRLIWEMRSRFGFPMLVAVIVWFSIESGSAGFSSKTLGVLQLCFIGALISRIPSAESWSFVQRLPVHSSESGRTYRNGVPRRRRDLLVGRGAGASPRASGSG